MGGNQKKAIGFLTVLISIYSFFWPKNAWALSSQITQVRFNPVNQPSSFTLGAPNSTSQPLRVQSINVSGSAESVNGGGFVTVEVNSNSLSGRFDTNHAGLFTSSSLVLNIPSGSQNTPNFYYLDTTDGRPQFTITVTQVSTNVSSLPVGLTTSTIFVVGNPTDISAVIEPPTSTPVNTDCIPPVLTLIGDASTTISVGTNYFEQGAKAVDETDGDISSKVIYVLERTIDTSAPGFYEIFYTVTDSAGNKTQALRTVRVVAVPDLVSPLISLSGDLSVKVPAGGDYQDPGATALDNVDGDLTAEIQVFTSTAFDALGQTVLTFLYSVADAAGNTASATRLVTYERSPNIPSIHILGVTTTKILIGQEYGDPGAVADDVEDGDLSNRIVVSGGVDTSVVGLYYLTYSVVDSDGNKAVPVSRIVEVVEETGSPAITSGADATTTVITPTLELEQDVLASPVSAASSGGIAIPVTVTNIPSPSLLKTFTLAPIAKVEAPAQVLGVKVTLLDELAESLFFGKSSADVKSLQDKLRTAGFFPKKLKSTGFYGPITLKAVLAYFSGKSGKNIVSFLLGQTRPGEQGEHVRQLQLALKKSLPSDTKVPVTGFYGPLTAAAVTKYQAVVPSL